MEASNARWKLTDGRVTRTKHLPKVTFASVICQAGKYPSYYDVVAFDEGRHGLEEGKPVTISGEMSMRKNKDSGKYELQLVVRRYEPGDDRKAPRPREQRRDPMDVPDPDPFNGDDVDF